MQTIAPSVPFPVFKSEGEPGIKYINFLSKIQLDHPVVVHLQQDTPLEVECESDGSLDFYFALMGVPVERDGDSPVPSRRRPSVRVSASFVLQQDRTEEEGMSAESKDDICYKVQRRRVRW